MRVLEVGCGVGGPAREIANFIGCEIVGITINQKQVDVARRLTEEAGLSDKLTFIHGDFLNLPFPDASYDAAYSIEATVHAPSLAAVAVYSGIARVIKPGGRLRTERVGHGTALRPIRRRPCKDQRQH